MGGQLKSLLGKVLSSETEWNPKVMLGRVVVRVVPDKLLHPLKRRYYAWLITHTPEDWIERDALVVEHLISAGDHAIDVGSNLGYFSKFLAERVGTAGRVYAFEPIPQTFDFLNYNVKKLGLNNIECINLALADAERTDTMVIPTYRWGQECWYDARLKEDGKDDSLRQFQIKCCTLDGFFEALGSFPKIAFIKCDANYHELEVLKGSLKTLETSHPALLIEVFPDPDNPSTTGFATFELLRSLQYEPYWFNGEAVAPRRVGERSQNYFFLMPEHVKKLEAKNLFRHNTPSK
jgi:FkbM family methyltransferase